MATSRAPARPRRILSLAGLTILGLSAASCQGALDPHGPQAERIADLAWVLFATAFIIFLLVMALLVGALVRRPRATDNESRERHILIGGGGIVLPAVVLFAVIGLTVDTLNDLTKPAPSDALRIEVTGQNYWWDVVYPDAGVRTANEIHIPVGETVAVTGTSMDVIHSFWAPEINGKMDLIPGKVNEFKLIASEPGVYRGQCAEFCGLGHAKMAFFLIAEPRDEFNEWLESQQGTPEALTAGELQAGREVFFSNSCASCHGITDNVGRPAAGPNLSHLATRDTIAAGTLPLTASALERWIRQPDEVKPGANMPSYEDLSPGEMDALLQFLLSLE